MVDKVLHHALHMEHSKGLVADKAYRQILHIKHNEALVDCKVEEPEVLEGDTR